MDPRDELRKRMKTLQQFAQQNRGGTGGPGPKAGFGAIGLVLAAGGAYVVANNALFNGMS